MSSRRLSSLIDRACPVCGSSGDSQIFAEANFDASRLDEFAFASRKVPEYMHYRLMTCSACDLLYASPLPTVEEVASAYEDAAYDSGDEARFAAHTYADIVRQLLPNLPDRSGALDIGAGDGAFLEELLRLGFTNVVGIEPSAAPIKAATDEVRPLLQQAMFDASDFAPKSFRLITCFQTMEHLHDPLSMCRDALQLLKPGGALLLVGHNRRSTVNRMMGFKSPIFDIEHLQLFSERSAHRMMENSGFTNITVKPISNTYPLRYWLRLFPLPSGLKARVLESFEKAGLGKRPIAIPVGNQMIAGYRSPRDSDGDQSAP